MPYLKVAKLSLSDQIFILIGIKPTKDDAAAAIVKHLNK
ncbi:hypothetical protein swp_4728 [Shewanella piezotolerans WP3]|uniref:Uncharacterized protein n=1 Tax=Shewanella piezotolerans (strain WP3 / JCM 13877) TaxID=225849 RepID=B8CTW7_SHEPW|nr:hypothetical protein swp_4728 [Shewanella piezotolerans WP3]